MKNVFFIPLGLPGLGKTTFAKIFMESYKNKIKLISYDALLVRH
jgi:Holliday junction resolvasome RuvABC ATP-dependent DNA helicase subunit